MAIDSVSISEIFHKAGVNLRFLGKVAKLTKMPHVKDICEAEMVARASKVIINQQITEFFLNKNKVKNYDTDSQFTQNQSADQKNKFMMQKLLEEKKQKIQEFYVDMLNFMFSNSYETV